MRKNWLFIILATTLVTVHFDTNAQTQNNRKYRNKANDPVGKLSDGRKLRWADDLFRQGSYFNAIDYYQQLKANDERNPFLTYQLAYCYRATRDYVPAAHYYAEANDLAKKVYPLASYYAALMLKQQGEYQAAINMFNQFLDDTKKITVVVASQGPKTAIEADPDRTQTAKTMKDIRKRARQEILGCEMAIKSIKEPQAVTILNAGPNVNTVYTELSPVPLGDTALLFSTMGRNAVIESNGYDKLQYKEHFLVSHKQPGYVDSFQWPLPFYDGGFNDPSVHIGNGCFSPGGDRFYYTRCSEGDSMIITCTILVSQFAEHRWGPAIPVGGNVNEPGSSNTMPCVAKIGGKKEVLFFSSNRKLQSRGQYDIWYSIIDPRNGSYRRPQNCGKKINTPGGSTYTPSITSGIVSLYLTARPPAGSPCGGVSGIIDIMVNPAATVNAGPDQTVCACADVTLAGSVGGSATSGTWSGGAGLFSPSATTLGGFYAPTTTEVATGLTLTLTTNDPVGPCGTATGTMHITWTHCGARNSGNPMDSVTGIPAESIKIYPNPVSSILYIEAPVKVLVSVISIDGKKLIDQTEAISINVAGLPDGMYMILVYDENKMLLKKERFVKLK